MTTFTGKEFERGKNKSSKQHLQINAFNKDTSFNGLSSTFLLHHFACKSAHSPTPCYTAKEIKYRCKLMAHIHCKYMEHMTYKHQFKVWTVDCLDYIHS